MKKPVTEERRFCDFCAEDHHEVPAYTKCVVCGKDLCVSHHLRLEVHTGRPGKVFRVELCPTHARVLAPILDGLRETSGNWEYPEFNEAGLKEIFRFMAK